MAEVNQVGNALTGSTGSGAFAGSVSPFFTTPNLGVAAATSIAFNPTTSGIVGTVSNDNASSGYVGEFIESVVPFASAVTLTTATPANITSISLTAGDWQIWGNVGTQDSGGLATVSSGWISASSATLPDLSVRSSFGDSGTFFTFNAPVPTVRASLSGTATYYLSCQATFTGPSCVGFGGIYARRLR